MKSLGDYAKILRDIATTLNLHGESVEMIVQMLANSLYISEVEHITYSQEASLERASNINSKIQHCVDQMYSVYRGANPRVYIRFEAQKLFVFNPHDQIIKSNNFNVYYLGYVDDSKSDDIKVINSAVSVYPGNSITILGILSSSIYESSWTVSSNTYYESHTESNLSGDIYLKDITTEEEVLDVTRHFYDHIRDEKMFDLTLPGYGCRIYYPENYDGGTRDNLPSRKFSLTAYKYLSLSSLIESELKSLKMTGATLVDHLETVCTALGFQESWPGLAYISETPRDGIESIHHKANKARFTGTYLATNSDLSFLLQEYFPEVIRTNGVTYRFEIPPSTTIDTIRHSYRLSNLDNKTTEILNRDKVKEENISSWREEKGTKEDEPDPDSSISWWVQDHDRLPAGTLRITCSRSGDGKIDNTSYEMILSSSIIPATSTNSGEITADLKTIEVQVIKNDSGQVTLGGVSDFGLSVSVSSGASVSGGTITINKATDLTVTLEKDGTVVDEEVIPVVTTPLVVTEETAEILGNSYAFNLSDDTLYIQTDLDGNITSSPNTTEASLYYNGTKISDGSCRYSIIPVSDLTATIDSSTGVLEILGMSEVLESSIIVMAEYNGVRQAKALKIKKSLSNVSSDSRPKEFELYYYDENKSRVPISTITATSEPKEYTIEIPENSYPNVNIDSGLTITSVRYDYSYTVLNNVIDQTKYTEIQAMVPSLCFYYIPYSNTLLTNSQIEDFKKKHQAYYVTENISIETGKKYTARFEINLGLYSNSVLDDSVSGILDNYGYRFGLDFGVGNADPDDPEKVVEQTETYKEIESLISKIPEVKYVSEIYVRYYQGDTRVSYLDVKEDLDVTYFELEHNIYSTVSISTES